MRAGGGGGGLSRKAEDKSKEREVHERNRYKPVEMTLQRHDVLHSTAEAPPGDLGRKGAARKVHQEQ